MKRPNLEALECLAEMLIGSPHVLDALALPVDGNGVRRSMADRREILIGAALVFARAERAVIRGHRVWDDYPAAVRMWVALLLATPSVPMTVEEARGVIALHSGAVRRRTP